MSAFRIVIPGNPYPKERPRFGKGRTYTAKKTLEEEKRIADAVRAAGVVLLPPPIRIEMWFYRQTRQPVDLDNLAKLVMDALNGVAWKDDRDVFDAPPHKRISGVNPRTVIELSRMDPAEIEESPPGKRTTGARKSKAKAVPLFAQEVPDGVPSRCPVTFGESYCCVLPDGHLDGHHMRRAS